MEQFAFATVFVLFCAVLAVILSSEDGDGNRQRGTERRTKTSVPRRRIVVRRGGKVSQYRVNRYGEVFDDKR